MTCPNVSSALFFVYLLGFKVSTIDGINSEPIRADKSVRNEAGASLYKQKITRCLGFEQFFENKSLVRGSYSTTDMQPMCNENLVAYQVSVTWEVAKP